MDWEYHGVYFNINKDGELGLYRKGDTDNTGAATNAQTNVSTVTFDKDGKINIGYVAFNENDPASAFADSTPFISLDQNNNAITINGNTNLTAKVTDTFQINSGTFKINGGSEALLNATTYRQQQQQMHQQLIAAFDSLIPLVTTTGAQLSAAGAAMVVPVVGAVTAAPLIAVAGASLTSAVAILTDMMTTIQTFESLSEEYLSKNNFQSDPE